MKQPWVWQLFSIIVLIICSNCSKKLKPEEYLNYIDKNGDKLCKTIERNGFITQICYRPNEYYAAQDMCIDTTFNAQDALNKYSNTMIFTCNIKAKDKVNDGQMLLQGNGFADFKKNVVNNTFEKKGYIFLLNEDDTINVSEYQYERNWGIGNGDAFVLAFSKKKLQQNPKKYHLIIRNLLPEIGTIDIKVAELLRSARGLKD